MAFEVLVRALGYLSDASQVEEGVMRGAELALLMEGGYLPELDACVVCRRPVDAGVRFTFVATRGGCVCERCLPGRGGISVDSALCRRLAEGARAWPDAMGPVGLDGRSLQQARDILTAFVGYHVGGRMKSARMLQELLG